jgi:glycosyltransferase involved in cell wall biosynthesis
VRLCVAICTRNRAGLVGAALASVVPLLGDGDELIVVDDGSTDGTVDVVRAALAGGKGRLVEQPAQGLSVARNTALAETSAPVVCFLDDDEQAEPAWLEALRRAWVRAGADVAAIGGPIRPSWGAPRPVWLEDRLLDVVTVLDLGPPARALEQTPRTGYLWGGNLSVRVSAAVQVGGFDPRLGLHPDRTWSRGEEEELQRRLVADGFEIRWEPEAAVRHTIPPERLSTGSFREFYRGRGVREASEGRARRAGLWGVIRGSMRFVVLRTLRHPSAPTARFTIAHGWALLTTRRR